MNKSAILLLSIFLSLHISAQQTTFDWASKCGNPPNTTDTRTCMAAGADGDFVMAGEFLGEAMFGDEVLNSAGGTDIFIASYNQAGDVTSAYRLGAADYEFAQDVEMDAAGNIFILGYFYGTTQIGSYQFTSYGSQDLFLAKVDDVGKVSWAQQIGGIMADYPSALSVDDDGDILVSGYFYDEISIGDTAILSSAGSDVFLARFDMDGQFTAVFQAGGSSSDQVRSLAVDNEGHLYIAGSFYYDITIGDTTLFTVDPVGVYVARITPGLQPEMVFQLDGTYLNTEVYVEADQAGHFYLGGSFSEDIYFGDLTFSAGEFNQDVYLAKYDGVGNLLWARHGQGAGSDQVTGLGTDGNNNVYMTGHYLDTLHFEQVTIPYTLCCGSREVYIINYSFDGRPWWGEQISGARTALHAMTVNSYNQVMMSGQFTEEVTLGTWTLSSFEGFMNFVTCLTGDIYTMVPQTTEDVTLTIFPNPARNLISLKAREKITRAEVFNLLGARQFVVEQEEVNVVDLGNLAGGTYFVRVTTAGGQMSARKVMVVD